jgi:serine/threonine protein kinase
VVFSGSYRISKGVPPLSVAFKRIKLPAYGISAEVVAALAREVQAMQRLNHPNLLRLFCVSDDAQAVGAHGRELGMCLCLEYCERGSLRDILKGASVDLPLEVNTLLVIPTGIFLTVLVVVVLADIS